MIISDSKFVASEYNALFIGVCINLVERSNNRFGNMFAKIDRNQNQILFHPANENGVLKFINALKNCGSNTKHLLNFITHIINLYEHIKL